MYRGGNWNNGANAGVFYLNGNNARSNVNVNIGFRPALALFVHGCESRLSSNSKAKGTRFRAEEAIEARPPSAVWRERARPRRLAGPA